MPKVRQNVEKGMNSMLKRFELTSYMENGDFALTCGAVQRIVITDEKIITLSVYDKSGNEIRHISADLTKDPACERILATAREKFSGRHDPFRGEEKNGTWEAVIETDDKVFRRSDYMAKAPEFYRAFSRDIRNCFHDLSLYVLTGGKDLRKFPGESMEELEESYSTFPKGCTIDEYYKELCDCAEYVYYDLDFHRKLKAHELLDSYRDKLSPYDVVVETEFAGGAGR